MRVYKNNETNQKKPDVGDFVSQCILLLMSYPRSQNFSGTAKQNGGEEHRTVARTFRQSIGKNFRGSDVTYECASNYDPCHKEIFL